MSLTAIDARLEPLLETAAKKEPSYADFLLEVISAEADARRQRYLKTRLQLAHLPYVKTFDQFDFAFQPSIDERQIRELRTLPRRWTGSCRRAVAESRCRSARRPRRCDPERMLARRRADDKPEIIDRRIRDFRNEAVLLVGWAGETRIVRVNADASIADVSTHIVAGLEDAWSKGVLPSALPAAHHRHAKAGFNYRSS